MLTRDVVSALADGLPVAGKVLANRFGVTRAAVWKRIEELRAAGLTIEAVPGSGYRLATVIDLLDHDRLLASFGAGLRARVGRLAVHWEIDSTNSELMREAAQLPDISICMAESQTAGRGRRGRHWQSPPLGNVYLSLLKKFDKGMGDLAGLSLVAGIALAQALDDCGARGHGLKWPNDVLANGRKLAGILVELGGEFLGPCHAVVGIGINLQLTDPVQDTIDQPAIDLRGLCPVVPTRTVVVAALLNRLVAALDRFAGHGFAPFRAEYAHYDLLQGALLQVSDARGVQSGIGAGVDDRGALCVDQAGAVVSFDSADVGVRRA